MRRATKSEIEKGLRERVLLVMKHAKLVDSTIETDVDFAKSIMTTNTSLSRWKNNPTGCPTAINIALCCERYGVSGTWLLTGKGEMSVDASLAEKVNAMEAKLEAALRMRRK